MAETYQPLTELDLDQFNRLIAQEGYTIDGQIKRLKMIEPLIMQRVELKMKQRRQELAVGVKDDRQIGKTIAAEFQPLHFEHIKTKDGQLAAVIVEKSGLPLGARADLTVFMPNHVDSITPQWPSFDPNDLGAVIDASGRFTNLGVFDEGQAFANAVTIMAEMRVPPGMRVYAGFVRGEEAPQSIGANAVIDEWHALDTVDIIVSSEIGPLPEEDIPAEGDKAMRYIIARPGRARMFTKFKVEEEQLGHASIPNLPNAKAERDRFQVWAEEIFTGEDPHGFDYGKDPQTGAARTSMARSHPLLGDERIDTGIEWYPNMVPSPGDVPGRDTAYVHTDEVHSKCYVRLVPPSTVESVLKDLAKVHEHIGGVRSWTERGIKSKLEKFAGEESYPPFAMPPRESNEAVRIVHDMLTKVAGVEAVPVRGDSVADENLYAGHMAERISERRDGGNPFEGTNNAVISIPPNGGHAHSPFEWTDADDMARVRHAIRRLLEDPDGFAQLMKKKA